MDSVLLHHPLVAVIRVLAGITGRRGQLARVGTSMCVFVAMHLGQVSVR